MKKSHRLSRRFKLTPDKELDPIVLRFNFKPLCVKVDFTVEDCEKRKEKLAAMGMYENIILRIYVQILNTETSSNLSQL